MNMNGYDVAEMSGAYWRGEARLEEELRRIYENSFRFFNESKGSPSRRLNIVNYAPWYYVEEGRRVLRCMAYRVRGEDGATSLGYEVKISGRWNSTLLGSSGHVDTGGDVINIIDWYAKPHLEHDAFYVTLLATVWAVCMAAGRVYNDEEYDVKEMEVDVDLRQNRDWTGPHIEYKAMVKRIGNPDSAQITVLFPEVKFMYDCALKGHLNLMSDEEASQYIETGRMPC